MTHQRLRDSARRIGIISATVTLPLTLPFVLTACSSASAGSVHGAELRAATDSDMLDVPSERVYEVDDISITVTTTEAVEQPDDAGGYDAFSAQPETAEEAAEATAEQRIDGLDYDGEVALSDGVITEARLSVTLEEQLPVTFTLTEPIVLRREGGTGVTVNAIGTLTVGAFERHGTAVSLTPVFENPDRAEMDFEIGSLDTMFLPATGHLGAVAENLDSITARVTLTAEDAEDDSDGSAEE